MPPQGRYTMQDSIGSGGAGRVYAAWDHQLGRHVAIKRIRDDAGIAASIRKEAGILASLNHPNIVTIYDFDSDEEGPFVVMEFVEGETLADRAEGRPVTLPFFLELINQLCRGLSAAHATGLLHLDLKPENIMLVFRPDGSFTAKILDFGLAILVHESQDNATELDCSPNTVAPELLQGLTPDQRTDIYSLGCVLYFALAGRHAFDAPTIDEVLKLHLAGTPLLIHVANPSVPEPISRALMKMIALDPFDRPQTAEDARRSIQATSRAPSASRIASIASLPTSSRRKNRAPAILFFLIAIAAGASYFIWPQVFKNLIASVSAPAASSPSPSSGSPTPVPTPAFPSVDPLDLAAIASHSGDTVIVQGTITSVGDSLLFHSIHLRFSDTNRDALVISIPQDNITVAQAHDYIGKQIRAQGTISTAANVNRLVLQSQSDLQVIKP